MFPLKRAFLSFPHILNSVQNYGWGEGGNNQVLRAVLEYGEIKIQITHVAWSAWKYVGVGKTKKYPININVCKAKNEYCNKYTKWTVKSKEIDC